jgi:CRP-like cAMP-binding protein
VPDSALAADDRVGSVQRQLFLRSLGGASASPTLLALVSKRIKDRFVPAGEVLFSAGAPSIEIYFVFEGEVELRAEGHEPWVLTAPSVIGAIDALYERPHARTAVAKTDLQVLALSSDEWFDTIEENFEIARDNVMRVAEGLARLELELPPNGGFPEPDDDAPVEPALGLNLVERMLLVRKSLAFRSATVQSVARLAQVAEEIELAAGEILHQPGKPAHSFYVVASGTVEITSVEPEVSARFGAGEIVFGAGAVGLRVPGFTSRALAPTVLLAIRREDFFDIMEDHFEVMRSVMKGVSHERERVLTERAERRGSRPLPGPT